MAFCVQLRPTPLPPLGGESGTETLYRLLLTCSGKLLYEAMQDESAELCFIFRSAHSVLYYPLENVVPEILLRIRCNKPVKVPLMLMHYRKYCTRAWSRGRYSTRLRLVLY